MNITRCFEILEISQDSTYEEAKAEYRLLSQFWHPDKHFHNAKMQAKATVKFKELNNAWSQIEDHFKNVAAREAEAKAKEAERRANEERERSERAEKEKLQRQRDSSKKADFQNRSNFSIITCPNCSTENRVPDGRYFEAKCGKCSSFLHPQKSRTLNIYGTCTDCGAALENDRGFCGKCGVLQIYTKKPHVQRDNSKCTDCGEILENDRGFCTKCGVIQV